MLRLIFTICYAYACGTVATSRNGFHVKYWKGTDATYIKDNLKRPDSDPSF